MYLKEIEAISLSGVAVRTSNQDEMTSSKAKIGDLWAQFYSQLGSQLIERSNVYGVYTQYESDFSGQYSVYAAADTIENNGDLATITIEAGSYLVFSSQGEIPQSVIALWGNIWEYFSNIDSPYERAYTTDFEHYKSPTSVDIYISIKKEQ